MNIENRQHLSNLLKHIFADNFSGLALPTADATKNSTNDNRAYAPTWSEEFFDIRNENPNNCVVLKIDGVELIAYNFVIDGKDYHITMMDYETIDPQGCILANGKICDKFELVEDWMGMSSLSEYGDYHPILEFAKMVDYDDGSLAE